MNFLAKLIDRESERYMGIIIIFDQTTWDYAYILESNNWIIVYWNR